MIELIEGGVKLVSLKNNESLSQYLNLYEEMLYGFLVSLAMKELRKNSL